MIDKTKKFIEKAIKIHGDKYDYSKVEYIKAHDKVIIICKEHGEFQVRANNHLIGIKCKNCSIIKNSNKNRKTLNEFINKAIEIHGNKYDYSKVDYINIDTKIIILCKLHGEFEQIPYSHLSGNNCPKCVGGVKYTINEFIEKAKEIHNNKYDYSLVNYINSKTKIIILCKLHGEFEQIPHSHLSGNNCPKCVGGVKYTINEFIEKAKEIHNNKYDYSLVNYINSHTKVIIQCNEHGIFKIIPNSLLSNHGCKKCFIQKNIVRCKSNNIAFIEKSNKIHDNKYDYSLINYINAHTKIIIICKIHGEFEQTPTGHLSGRSCLKCNKNGYSKSQINWLNFISKYNNIDIQHVENIGEFLIPTTKYKADGYYKETNTIYEFHGDLWHGNPKIFNPDDISYFGVKYGELYKNTLKREEHIKNLGYNLVVMWEYDWNKINKSIKILQRKFCIFKLH